MGRFAEVYRRSLAEPEADRMTYGELKHYIGELKASGYHVVPYMVQLQRKVAFPFVTLRLILSTSTAKCPTARGGPRASRVNCAMPTREPGTTPRASRQRAT